MSADDGSPAWLPVVLLAAVRQPSAVHRTMVCPEMPSSARHVGDNDVAGRPGMSVVALNSVRPPVSQRPW